MKAGTYLRNFNTSHEDHNSRELLNGQFYISLFSKNKQDMSLLIFEKLLQRRLHEKCGEIINLELFTLRNLM